MANLTHLLHPRDALVETMSRIYRCKMTTTSGGNLSIRDEDGVIWITPARVDKGRLTRNDIIQILPDGSTDGPHPPSSENPFHRATYRSREDIHAVVHAHPIALVAFSICAQVPNTRIYPQAFFVCDTPVFAPYALPGSEMLGERIGEAFTHQSRPSCVILENHGVVVGGPTPPVAFQRFEALEFAAKTIVRASMLGEVKYLTDEQLEMASKRTLKMETFEPGPASIKERELRRELRDMLHRGCRQRLFISTEGSFSARVDEDSFLITPYDRDREFLEIDDFILVKGDTCEAGKQPSRALLAHQAIYRKHPHAQAIVFAHPVNITAFSCTDVDFNVNTIPESYVFLRETRRAPYGVQFEDDGRIADYLSEETPALVLENDGAVVVGKNVLDAFDRLEVLESTAEAIIDGNAIGEVIVMNDQVIGELKAAFFG